MNDIDYIDALLRYGTIKIVLHDERKVNNYMCGVTGKVSEKIAKFLRNDIMRVGAYGSFSEWVNQVNQGPVL